MPKPITECFLGADALLLKTDSETWTQAESGVKEETILKEIEMCSKNRDSLEKALLILSSTPMIAIFALMASRAAAEDGNYPFGMQLVFLAAPILYLFILYNIVKYMTKMVRLNSYLGYLEDIFTAHYRMRDVMIWHREVNIEERYSFTGSLFQVPFHLAALALLVYAAWQAAFSVWSVAFVIVVAVAVLAVILVGCVVIMGIAAAMAHWDTKASINKDRIRNRLTPMPPYYSEFWTYLRIYAQEKKCLAKLENMRKAGSFPFEEFGLVFKSEAEACEESCEKSSSDDDRCSYLSVAIEIKLEKECDISPIVNSDRVSSGNLYVPISFAGKDTLMALWQIEPGKVFALASLMVPARAGDLVALWDPKTLQGKDVGAKPIGWARVERVAAWL